MKLAPAARGSGEAGFEQALRDKFTLLSNWYWLIKLEFINLVAPNETMVLNGTLLSVYPKIPKAGIIHPWFCPSKRRIFARLLSF